jgi:hypothetical protein
MKGMKVSLMTITLAGLLLGFTSVASAQVYDLYYYWDGTQYQQFLPQQYDPSYYGDQQNPAYYDPYYQLHVLHYQLYLPQYGAYPVYGPCCFGGVVFPSWRPARVRSLPPVIVSPWRPSPVSPLPPVVISPFLGTTRRR